jgi:ABC-type antimicrobial peptide transport system permease subunit
MNTAIIALGAGVVLVGGYFVYKATSLPTEQVASACSDDWTDAFNPACWASKADAGLSNAANTFSNELNTVLIILAVVVVLVIGLLAFGPGTEHLARGAMAFRP